MTDCSSKYDKGVYDMFSAMFSYLPLAHVVDGRIFVVPHTHTHTHTQLKTLISSLLFIIIITHIL